MCSQCKCLQMLDRLQQIRLNRRKKVHAASVLGVHIFTLLFPKVTIHNGPVKRRKGSSNFKMVHANTVILRKIIEQ